MALDFPSLVKALSPIVKEPHLSYLNRSSHVNIHEFIDNSGRLIARTWRGAFRPGYIFVRGTGAAALYILLFWLQHAANSLGSSLDDYLRLIAQQFPLGEWRSGTGRLSIPRGAGAGKIIVDTILTELIPDMGRDEFPQPDAYRYLERSNPKLLNKLNVLFRPSGWKPFVREFTDEEVGAGVYIIVGLNRGLNRVKIRSGKATDLRERLQSHLSTIKEEFPSGIRPIFYSTSRQSRRGLETAEKALFHLIKPDIRLRNARHPSPCSLCRSGLR